MRSKGTRCWLVLCLVSRASDAPRVVRRSDARPPQWTSDKRLLRLLATSGAIFAAIRLSILAALANAGPDITAAITPVTPVTTLVIALVTRVESLDVRSWPGVAQARELWRRRQLSARG